MSKHTPGPWCWRPSAWDTSWLENANGDYVLRALDGRVYDEFDSDSATIDVTEANARLIAAAPELLEALKNLCQHGENVVKNVRIGQHNIYHIGLDGLDVLLANARAAIAKAGGAE